MSLEIIKPGFLSLVQDYGRYGYQKVGITNGGPLDEHAFLWANYLLNNNHNDAQIEINFGNFEAKFVKDTMIILCGGDLGATLNDDKLPTWQTHPVKSGDVIKIYTPKTGLRAYLAVKGGFQVIEHLSSCATVIREKLGGLKRSGDKIKEGEKIEYICSGHRVSRRIPPQFLPEYPNHITLRFIPNTTVTGVDHEAIERFTQITYEVSQNIDRMGYRLIGEPLKLSSTGIISQGISMGAIQMPHDGQPIVLLKDRQTMGGYPLIGCVNYLDCSQLVQSKPGTTISFLKFDLNDAEAEFMLYKKFFDLPF